MGVVRQELLSGIGDKRVFDRLREKLRSFPDVSLEIEDHEEAASFSNTCRIHGVQGSLIDFLICAFATRRGYQILTTDADFQHFSDHIPIALLKP